MKPPNGYGLALIIFDSGEITDESRRYQLVLEKLMTCVDYVASGQYREQAPTVEQKDVKIHIVCRTRPNANMERIAYMASRQPPIVRVPVVIESEQEFRQRAASQKHD